jgi:hypothetical protein
VIDALRAAAGPTLRAWIDANRARVEYVTRTLDAPRVPRVPPELIAALGTAPDAEIAARFGRNESSVRSLRLDRGIPPSIAGRERLILDTLAAHPEWSLRRVAREVGVAVTTVIATRERAERGAGYTQMEPGQKASTRRARRRTPEPGGV